MSESDSDEQLLNQGNLELLMRTALEDGTALGMSRHVLFLSLSILIYSYDRSNMTVCTR